MPRPKQLGIRRLAWDVRALDAAIDALPISGSSPDDETWSDIDASQVATIR